MECLASQRGRGGRHVTFKSELGRTNHYNRLTSGKNISIHSLRNIQPNSAIKRRPCNMRCRQRPSASNQPSIQSHNQEKGRQLDRALAGQIFKNTNKAKEHSLMLDLLGCWSLTLAEHLRTSQHIYSPCCVVNLQRTLYPSL